MLHDCKAEVTIKKVDNGFVVEWEHKRIKIPKRLRARMRDEDDEPNFHDPSGVDIFKTEKEALERAKYILNRV